MNHIQSDKQYSLEVSGKELLSISYVLTMIKNGAPVEMKAAKELPTSLNYKEIE